MKNTESLLKLLSENKLDDLKSALLENLQEEIEKGKGTKKSDLSIIRSIIKAAPPTVNGRIVSYFAGEKTNIFCDGHVIFSDSENDFSIPEKENCTLNFSTWWKNTDSKQVINKNELLFFIKTPEYKASKNLLPYIFKLENGAFYSFNPRYLLDAMSFCGVDHFEFCENDYKNGQYNVPVQFTSKDGKRHAFVLPVHLRDCYKSLKLQNEILSI